MLLKIFIIFLYMEKISPKMAAAFGAGFLGFIMVAYSYNKSHKPDYGEQLVENFNNDENINSKESLGSTNTVDSNTVDSNTVDSNTVDANTVDSNTVDANTVDATTYANTVDPGAVDVIGIKKEVDDEVKDDKKTWSKYWKSEYENLKEK